MWITGDWRPGYWEEAARYVAENALLRVNQYSIDQTPLHVPYPGVFPILFLCAEAGVWLVQVGDVHNYLLSTAPRFAAMFLAGAVVYQFRDRLPIRLPLTLAGLAVLVA